MSSEKKIQKKNAAVDYVSDSYQELHKVTWPTKNRAVRLTFLVLGVCLVVAIFIGILDFIFGAGYRALLEAGPDRALPASVETAPVEAGAEESGFSIGDVNIVDSEGTTITTEGTVTTDLPSEGTEAPAES